MPAESLTAYVADFVASTRLADIPAPVLELGKKSILDGLGLALAGSVAKSGVQYPYWGGGSGRWDGPYKYWPWTSRITTVCP